MYALTLQQPWATAITVLGKNIENRTWTPPADVIGTRIVIHAGKTCRLEDVALLSSSGFRLPEPLPAGAIVGTAIVRGWVQGKRGAKLGGKGTTYSRGLRPAWAQKALGSPWYQGEEFYGWLLGDVRGLSAPIPVRGAQGLWIVPPELERLLSKRAG